MAEEEAPENVRQRGVRARRRFKALVRMVMINRAWLVGDPEEDLNHDFRKNVKLLSSKRQQKSILTLHLKAILCKPHDERTEEDISLLLKTISNIKCFRKYDDNVKKKIAGFAYFRFFGPGRVLVRQNHEAHALYIIISGDVSVSVTTFDPILNYYENTFMKTLTKGDMFGEVSLLSGMKRSATMTTTTPVELLLVNNEDFNEVLRETLQTQWNYIIGHLDSFTYFEDWDYPTKQNCCVISKLKKFAKNETIIGDGVGMPQYVHLLLKGQCRLIEHLLLDTTKTHNGKITYKLHVKPPDNYVHSTMTLQGSPHISTNKEEPIKGVRKTESSKLVHSEKRGTIRFSAKNIAKSRQSVSPYQKSKRKLVQSEHRLSGMEIGRRSSSRRLTVHSMDDEISQLAIQDTTALRYNELEHLHYFPDKATTVFMQVCIYSEKACFCVGENMERRRIVALSPVELLLIPRYWIDSTPNPNKWGQIKAYLDARIPSTKNIFDKFVQNREWKNKIHIPQCKRPTRNCLANVPYSIRVREGFNL
ncbi:PREDICTED: uncharacterized protein LOC108569968 [Nicrophorus vespilloides]|uniref:Uncharacterized protein LOC108569968 n=1 Tax=Nicrophorus vespilloides TaxID=110193 RepID=A0ABM1NKA4_NICVS|nr:PREDICTED: uncharacterized protein LOC108569968 [Nicrophorus vespilloides]